jgi:hypothetical protein
LNLPTELMEKAEEAERKHREQLRVIDTILGPPPAGSGPIINMMAQGWRRRAEQHLARGPFDPRRV